MEIKADIFIKFFLGMQEEKVNIFQQNIFQLILWSSS